MFNRANYTIDTVESSATYLTPQSDRTAPRRSASDCRTRRGCSRSDSRACEGNPANPSFKVAEIPSTAGILGDL